MSYVKGDFNNGMSGLSLNSLVSSVTDKLATNTKTSVVKQLNDPEFKAAVDTFANNFFNERKHIIYPVAIALGGFALMGLVNIAIWPRGK